MKTGVGGCERVISRRGTEEADQQTDIVTVKEMRHVDRGCNRVSPVSSFFKKMPAEMEPEERRTHDHSHSSKSEESGNYAADMQESALRGDVNNKSPKMAATTQAANGARDRQTDTAAGAVETTGTSDRDECFRECMRRLVEEVLPLVQTYPPKMAGSESEVMNAAIDLVLYRNLADAIEFCYVESDGRFTERQLAQLAAVARTRIIPAYLSFFRAHFGTRVHAGECGSEAESSLGPSTDKSFYFFVRQESNASWPKVQCEEREFVC